MPTDFIRTDEAQPHPERTRAILAAHPDVRSLMGRNPWTSVILVAIVAVQIGMAALAGKAGWDWLLIFLILAYGLGAFANHALYVIIHEATHNLIFRQRSLNKMVMIFADLPNLVPGAIGFGIFHLQHHAHQGDYEHDADLASHWEAALIGNRWYMKALWLLFFPVFQLLRPARLRAYRVITPWTLLNTTAAVCFDLAVGYWLGPCALIYLGASMLFSIGLHPLGARWIQEHYTNDQAQETFSYYGPLNRLAMNVGYHNEHHDFPSVPWNRLPALRHRCAAFYDSLSSHESWTRLLLRFVFDPDYTLYSRVVRPKRTGGSAALRQKALTPGPIALSNEN